MLQFGARHVSYYCTGPVLRASSTIHQSTLSPLPSPFLFSPYYLIRTVSLSPRHRSCPPTRLPSPPLPPSRPPPPSTPVTYPEKLSALSAWEVSARGEGARLWKAPEAANAPRGEKQKQKKRKGKTKGQRSPCVFFFLLLQAAGQQVRATRWGLKATSQLFFFFFKKKGECRRSSLKVGRQGYGGDVGGWGLASASQRRCINRPGPHLEEEERETIKLHPCIFSCVVLQFSVPTLLVWRRSYALDSVGGKVAFYINKLTSSAHKICIK